MMQRESTDRKHGRILIVEDEHLLAWSIASALEKEGYRSVVAESGEDALSDLLSDRFDVVITDLNLPCVDGATVATVAKKAFPNLPVVMISGEPGAITRGLEKNHLIDYFVEKPFDLKQMTRLVGKCMQERSNSTRA
jgi:DNA-binding NtrC family response regulator